MGSELLQPSDGVVGSGRLSWSISAYLWRLLYSNLLTMLAVVVSAGSLHWSICQILDQKPFRGEGREEMALAF